MNRCIACYATCYYDVRYKLSRLPFTESWAAEIFFFFLGSPLKIFIQKHAAEAESAVL